jgi:ribA/ribD-fused uncharacterized protein
MQVRFYDPQDENGWLANFSSHSILLDGRVWRTVEHYFQAQKFASAAIRARIQNTPSPAVAKLLAKELKPLRRRDWHEVRDDVMMRAIRAKFTQHADLMFKLIATGEAEIIEDAKNDRYWGAGKDGTGRNRMGELLMALRFEIGEEARRAA